MAIKTSGTISLIDFNTELNKNATDFYSLDSAESRGLAGIPSGLISFDNFYGKSSVIDRILLTSKGTNLITDPNNYGTKYFYPLDQYLSQDLTEDWTYDYIPGTPISEMPETFRHNGTRWVFSGSYSISLYYAHWVGIWDDSQLYYPLIKFGNGSYLRFSLYNSSNIEKQVIWSQTSSGDRDTFLKEFRSGLTLNVADGDYLAYKLYWPSSVNIVGDDRAFTAYDTSWTTNWWYGDTPMRVEIINNSI